METEFLVYNGADLVSSFGGENVETVWRNRWSRLARCGLDRSFPLEALVRNVQSTLCRIGKTGRPLVSCTDRSLVGPRSPQVPDACYAPGSKFVLDTVPYGASSLRTWWPIHAPGSTN
jgi:hypothetical protein